jgi:hypothetical protein
MLCYNSTIRCERRASIKYCGISNGYTVYVYVACYRLLNIALAATNTTACPTGPTYQTVVIATNDRRTI